MESYSLRPGYSPCGNDDREDEEADDGDDLFARRSISPRLNTEVRAPHFDRREPELEFSVHSRSAQVDQYNEDVADCDPSCRTV